MAYRSYNTSCTRGYPVVMYVTAGCGTVTPHEYRDLLALVEAQEGHPVDEDHIPWYLVIVDTFTVLLRQPDDDEADGDAQSIDLGEPERWDTCSRCHRRGGNATLNDEGDLLQLCSCCSDGVW